MSVYQGTREAPIIIDDDDDNVAPVAGPSKPKLSQTSTNTNAQPRTSKNSSKARAATSNPSCGSTRSSKAANVVHYREVPLSQPHRETATPLHPNPRNMNNTPSLKRKRGLEDHTIKVQRPQPPPPGQVASTPGPSGDPFAGLTKKQRKKLRKRLQAEEEMKKKMAAHRSFPPPPQPTVQISNNSALPPRNAGPDRAIHSGPSWPIHIAKESEPPIPGPGQGPLTLSEESAPVLPPQRASNDILGAPKSALTNSQQKQSQPQPLPPIPTPSKAVTSMLPNIFGAHNRIIGKIASLGSSFGLFPVSPDQYVPHDPTRTIVLENMPKRFRTLDFVLQWCRDTAHASDPEPLHVDVMRKLGKALVEFTTHERALRAFNSPKLINEDGRAQISVYWFCPEPTPLPLLHPTTQVSHPLPPRPSQNVCAASLTPSNSRSMSGTTYMQPTRQSFSMASFVPSKTSILPSLLTRDDARNQRILPQDTEIEDGEIEEERIPNGVIDDADSLHSTPRNSPYRDDFTRTDQQSRTQQWTDALAGFESGTMMVSASQSSLKKPVEVGTQQASPSGVKSANELIVSSIVTPSSSQLSYEDIAMGDESPQLMYPSPDDPVPDLYSRSTPPNMTEEDANVSRSESTDVDMELEISKVLPPTIPGSLARSSSSVERAFFPAPPAPTTAEATPDGCEGQIPGPGQHVLVATSVPEVRREVENENVASVHAAIESTSQNMSEKLSELRMRVLASRKRKVPPPETDAPAAPPTAPVHNASKQGRLGQMTRKRLLLERKKQLELAACSQARRSPTSVTFEPEGPGHLHPAGIHNSTEVSPRIQPFSHGSFVHAQDSTINPFAESSNSSIATSSDSAASLFSITSSTTASSVSSTKNNGMAKSASFLDSMATEFLHDILGPVKPDSPSAPATISESPSEASIDSTALLQKKQERYEEHVAKSKSLFALWETAKEKAEKSRIWALIKAENRSFEAEEAAADAKLKSIEAVKTMSTRPIAPKKLSFKNWPQTSRDALVFAVSDSEDDE